jgi:hypothetical protein
LLCGNAINFKKMKRFILGLQLIGAAVAANSQQKMTERDTASMGGIMQVVGLNAIDDLRSSHVYRLGFKRVWTRGYYSPGDEGGSAYTWNDTSTHTDDGGGYVKPNSVKGAGRWILLPTNGVVNFRQFGGRNEYVHPGNMGYDNRQAMINALDFCNGYTALGYKYARYKLYIPTINQLRYYYISDSIVVSTSLEMYGDPSGLQTVLMFPSGKPGLVFPYPGSAGHKFGVTGCYIHDLRIASNATSLLIGGGANGMTVRSPNRFERMYVTGFANNGVAIMATAPNGNANNSYFQSVSSDGNQGIGYFIDGADANNCTFIMCDASSNGGWGFWDSSFLGNNFFGDHTAENGLKYTQVHHLGRLYQAIDTSGPIVSGPVEPGVAQSWQKFWLLQGEGKVAAFYPEWVRTKDYYPGGSYYLDNANQLGTLVGCYTEGGQPLARNLGGSLFLNGFAALTKPSHYFAVNSHGVEVDRLAGSNVEGMHVFINQAGYKAVFGIADDVHGYNLGWQGDSANRLLTTEQSNSPGPMKIFSNNTPASFLGRSNGVSPGSMGTSDFFYFKGGSGYKRFSFSNAAPSSGPWEVGDFVMNSSPVTGAPIGWRCIRAGSPGTWEALTVSSSRSTGVGASFKTGASYADYLKLSDDGTPQAGELRSAVNIMLNHDGEEYTLVKALTSAASLDFPDTAPQADCDLTVPVKGVAVGDEVCLGIPNSAVVHGGTYSAWVSGAGTVTIRFSNYSQTSKDPGSGIFKLSVIKR